MKTQLPVVDGHPDTNDKRIMQMISGFFVTCYRMKHTSEVQK